MDLFNTTKRPPQSQPASAKLQKVFKELTLWSRKV